MFRIAVTELFFAATSSKEGTDASKLICPVLVKYFCCANVEAPSSRKKYNKVFMSLFFNFLKAHPLAIE